MTNLSFLNTSQTFSVAFIRATNRNKVHSQILESLHRSGMTRQDLAKKLNVPVKRVNDMLAGPSALTLDSISDLMFAIEGAVVALTVKPVTK